MKARGHPEGEIDMEPIERVRQIIHLPVWETPPHIQELRDILRTLDVASLRALLAEGLAEHDQAIEQAGQPTPWLRAPDDAGLDLILWIAQVRPDACDGLAAELWRRRVLGHGVLYRGADAATRDAILAEADDMLDALIEAFPDIAVSSLQWGDPAIRDRLQALTQQREWDELDVMLRMLAWIGDDMVRRWLQTRGRAWGALFYLSAEDYASEGGWGLTTDKARRELTFLVAYQLVDREDTDAKEDASGGPVAVMTPFDDHCRWCGRRLTALLDLDLRDPALTFLHLNGTRLRLVICEECSLWNRVYMDVSLAGGARWNAHNEREGQSYGAGDGEMWLTPTDHHLVLGPRCVSATEAVARGNDWDISQVGGMPGWVQNADYPPCPSCQRRMLFVGEVAVEVVTDRAIDGVFYGFLCPDCLLTTAIYQCT